MRKAMVKEREKTKTTPSAKDLLRAQCEAELVDTRILVYFQYDDDGKPVIQDMSINRDTMYEDLMEALDEKEEEVNTDCSDYELEDNLESWLEWNHPEYQKYMDDVFHCYCCKDLKTCKPLLLRGTETRREALERLYPPAWEAQGAGAQGTREDGPLQLEDLRGFRGIRYPNASATKPRASEVTKQNSKPFSLFIESGGKHGKRKDSKKAASKGQAKAKGKA
jgi:hypothetical protein